MLWILAVAATPALASAEEIAVIVNKERTVGLDRTELARIFLKQRRFWPDGTPILPVNRSAGSDLREGFETVVFGNAASRLSAHWNREYFHGVLPPLTLASDEAVIRFVLQDSRAIGYVRAGLVDDSIHVLLRLESPADASTP